VAARGPNVQYDQAGSPAPVAGTIRPRPLRWVVAAIVLLSLGIAQSATGRPGTTSAAVDCHWQVSGTWRTQTPPYQPVFRLTQAGTKISGTETFSPADAAAAGFPNPTATVAGTLVGDEIDLIATFHGVLKVGRRAAGTLQAEYKGTITKGAITNGTGQDITTPNTTAGPWSGTGPADCVTRYLWSASAKKSAVTGVRVLLPELPNGGDTSYRELTGAATSYGLFETGSAGKPQNVQGKLSISVLYRRALSGVNAPLTVERTITFDIVSAQSFAPPNPDGPRGGTVQLKLKLERDNFLACNPNDVGTLTLIDAGSATKGFRITGLDSACSAGGKIQSGALAGDNPLDMARAETLSVAIRKRP
jgi:hypothetical protein